MLIAVRIIQFHRRREFTQQRRHRLVRHAVEHEGLLRFGDVQHVVDRQAALLQRDDVTFAVVQLDIQRNMQRQLLRLIGGRRGFLADMQAILLSFRIVLVAHRQQRRAGLAIPTAEARQIHVGRVLHRLHEVIAGRGAAVVAFEIELHPFLEVLFPQQGVHHADHFRTFLIHRQGVKVVHLDDFIRTNGVRHRAGVFGELRAAHHAHVIDAVDRTRAQIGTELLIAEHRQPLFQAELEPVAAGDAVAGPVVEVFVANHRFDVQVIFVGGGFRLRQHVFGVKDI
ncbi:Uncharacterised protein [Acinetobacter baumannii]|nr:Uncharacterised protein [Acinetobacter baumannii]